MNEIKMDKLIKTFQLLIVVAFVYSVIWPIYLFTNDLPIGYSIAGELWSIQSSELESLDAFVIFSLTNLKNVIWVYGLFQINKLCANYRQDKVFSAVNAGYLQSFGIVLILISLCETLIHPIVTHWFYWRGISPGLADLPFVMAINTSLLMVGVIFTVIAKIMKRASILQEEMKLTV